MIDACLERNSNKFNVLNQTLLDFEILFNSQMSAFQIFLEDKEMSFSNKKTAQIIPVVIGPAGQDIQSASVWSSTNW